MKWGTGFWEPFIYSVSRGGVEYVGIAPDVARKVFHSATWVRMRAKLNRGPSPDGWNVKLVSGRPVKRKTPEIMVAENDNDDPIIGTASEIAELIEMSGESVRLLRRTGRKSRRGWSVRPATEEERRSMNESDAG